MKPGLPGQPVTQALVDQALALTPDTMPTDVRTLALQCILDTFGVMLAARDEPLVRLLADAAQEEGGRQQSTVLCDGLRASVAQAALCDGTLAHALDYDDANLNINGHPSAVFLPALLALGESIDASGRDLLVAFVAGYELACRAGSLVQPDHYARGFHSTATVGAFGAAMACAHLLGLDASRSGHAMGIAGTRASGLKAMFGTDCKAYTRGPRARSGRHRADRDPGREGQRRHLQHRPPGRIVLSNAPASRHEVAFRPQAARQCAAPGQASTPDQPGIAKEWRGVKVPGHVDEVLVLALVTTLK